MFSFVLAMTAAFLGAPAIAADLESGVAQAMLARPIRRADLVVGRWLGLAAVVVAYAVAVRAARDRRGRLRQRLHAAAAAPRRRVPGRAGDRAADVRAAAQHAAAGDRGRGDLRRAVRARLDGRRVRRGRPVLRRRAARHRVRGVAAGCCRATASGAARSTALEPPAVDLRDARPGRARPPAANPFFAAAPPPTEFVAWSVVWVVIVLGLAVDLAGAPRPVGRRGRHAWRGVPDAAGLPSTA